MPRLRVLSSSPSALRLPFFGLLLLTACASHAAAQEPAGGLQALPLDSLIAQVGGDAGRAAFEEMVRRGPASAPQLAAYLRGAPRPRAIAVNVLVRLGEPGQRVLLDELRRMAPRDRDNVLDVLPNAAAAAPDGVDMLPLSASLLADSAVAVRRTGARMLERRWYREGGEGAAFDPARDTLLLAALGDRTAEVRQAAIGAVDGTRAASPAVIHRLMEMMGGDGEAEVRSEAALALGWLHPKAAAAVPALITALREDPDVCVRRRAAQSLGDIGPPAASAVPALLVATRADDEDLRTAAIAALGDIGLGPPVDAAAVLAAMRAALAHPDTVARGVTVSSLSYLDARATPLLVEALGDPEPEIAASAATYLGERPADAATVDALVAALADPRESLRNAAADALGGFGTALLPRLRALARDGGESARAGAERAIAYVQEATRLAVANACYELRRGPWEPRREIGGDSVFSTPPDRIRFTTVFAPGSRREGSGRAGGYSFVVERAGMQRGGWTLGSWRPLPGRDALELVWSNGFSVVALELEVDARGALRGSARTFWDFTRDSQTAPVEGEPFPCPDDDGSGRGPA